MNKPTDQQIAQIGLELLDTVPHPGNQPTRQFCAKFSLVYTFLEEIAARVDPVEPPEGDGLKVSD